MSIYRKSVILPRNEAYFFCEEQTLYGSARLGTEQVEHSMCGLVTQDVLTDEITRAREQYGEDWQAHLKEQYDGRFYERLKESWGDEWQKRLDLILQGSTDGWLVGQIRNENYTLQIGNKRYELSNHLGNVLAVVSDKKEQTDGAVWSAVVVSAQDYYPFGMAMPGRSSGSYKYGFNGKETDPETGLNDFGARLYDGRLGRWLAVDPLAKKYPELTPYNFVGNMPIIAIDPDGKEIIVTTTKVGEKTIVQITYTGVLKDRTGTMDNEKLETLKNDIVSELKAIYTGAGAQMEWSINVNLRVDANPTEKDNIIEIRNDDGETDNTVNYGEGSSFAPDAVHAYVALNPAKGTVARSSAHEIGHNMGLPHIIDDAVIEGLAIVEGLKQGKNLPWAAVANSAIKDNLMLPGTAWGTDNVITESQIQRIAARLPRTEQGGNQPWGSLSTDAPVYKFVWKPESLQLTPLKELSKPTIGMGKNNGGIGIRLPDAPITKPTPSPTSQLGKIELKQVGQ